MFNYAYVLIALINFDAPSWKFALGLFSLPQPHILIYVTHNFYSDKIITQKGNFAGHCPIFIYIFKPVKEYTLRTPWLLSVSKTSISLKPTTEGRGRRGMVGMALPFADRTGVGGE